MKTLLVPVDFSESTENVIKYAAGFSCDTHVDRIILLKSYYVSVYAQLLPSADFVQMSADDINAERQKVEASLKHLSAELYRKCMPTIKIDTALSDLPLVRAIHNVIAEEKPNLVLIGSDELPYENDSYIGEQIIAIGKTSPVPVLIVPGHVHYQKIETALVPCDFGAISRLSALQNFRDPKKWLHPQLMVLNVDSKQKHREDDQQLADGLVSLLDGYDFKVYHSDDKDIVHGIFSFARQHDPQMIIALPGKYSFFYNLTHRNITKALALNARRPVLILK
jgi:nucleotide-binding universal stress UspA family protein